MYEIKYIGLVLIIALLSSAFAACSNAGALIADDLRESILTSADDINSYRFEGTMSVSSAEEPEVDMSLDINGAVDIQNMNTNMTLQGGTENIPMEAEVYLINNAPYQSSPSYVMHINSEIDGDLSGWINMDVPVTEWDEQDQLMQQLEALSIAEVKHNGSETVEGTDCYVFDIVLETDDFLEFALQQPGIDDMLDGITSAELLEMIGDITSKYWVAKDTDLPVKQQLHFSLAINDITSDIDMTIRFYDFNSAGSIALPQDYLDWLATDNRSAIIETSMGTIELELYEKKAPITTANFISLAQDGFYDGLIFHRVMDDFVIQGGDPLGTGTGGSDTAINLEIHPNLRHIDGAISMARTPDPNSATSQFFICDGAQEFLDDQYAVFGVVTDGIEVVRAIAAVDTDDSDKPDTDVVITTITIE
jgi:cyclophilin family peptidyl-prolyl cis-trans isomerase